MDHQDFLPGYDWPAPHNIVPFQHQKETASFLTGHRKAFCFNEQGTGKTASVIWATDYLMKLGMLRRVLVVCPLSIMHSAWQQDLFKFAVHRRVDVAYGSSAKRKQIVNGDAEYVIINYDGVSICKAEIINNSFDLIVIDEASAYKNAQTDRWKTMRDILKHVKGLWMLTGTPAAQSPVDAYGLAKLVNPQALPTFFAQFRDMVMTPVALHRWKPKPQANSVVHKVLQPAIRFEKRQCIDLPEITFSDRAAPMTAQQTKYYKKLKTDMLVEAAGEEITAVNAAILLNKLLQVACGSVYTDNREVLDFDASARLNAVKEVIDESSNKVLVFVPFTHTIEQVRKHLNKHGVNNDVINGDVPVHKRTEIVKRFQEQQDPKVLIIQPQAASHGLTLTAADTIVWYAPVTSVETYLQANARIDRPGQKNAMTVVHIKSSPIEDRMYSMLRKNMMTHADIINLYKQEMAEGA